VIEINKLIDEELSADGLTPENVDPSKPETIPKFVDALPIPEVLKPDSVGPGYSYYEIEMRRGLHRFHKYFPVTQIWGYNGTYPGPTIETDRHNSVYVKWINKLPSKHFLPVDKTLHGAIAAPEVRTVVHLHGADVAPHSDGYPEAWFTRGYEQTGPEFSRKVYVYHNNQQATTLWYHDHAMGTTRLNVYAGLAGFYIIHDELEKSLELPKGEYDIPLLIQDKSFNADGSMFYPDGPNPPAKVTPSVVPAFIGQTMIVNGKIWPHLKVEPRKYRFRILNASNTRGYTMKLSNDQSFWQIGTDGGMLTKPQEIKSFILEPAERIDVIIDFSALKDQSISLITGNPDPDIMQFKVELPLKGEDTSKIPEELHYVEHMHEDMASKKRTVFLDGGQDHYGRPMLLLSNHMWHEPATEKPKYDSIEVWRIANLTNFPHPIHLHLVQFQILDRRPFDVAYFRETGKIRYSSANPAEKPLDFEQGWKDVVRAEPGKVTRIIVHFKNFSGDYVWHCHILEHEDHDMMRVLRVEKETVD
jgi:spore coat protein A, manganese oxidase